MKINLIETCFQCNELKDEVLTLKDENGDYHICENCLGHYLNGEIKFVDAGDVAE